MEISKITPYIKNAKLHPKKQVEKVAASIKEFGFNQPIVIDRQGVIIVGHGRFEAAKLLGMTDVPVVEVDLTEEQAKAYRLADNKLNESEWDMKLAVDELKELSEEMQVLTGFDLDLLIEPDEKDDEIPENVPPMAQLGDLYQLGNHRVLCGDSTKIEDVLRLMGGIKADMVFTDPPYGFNYEKKSTGESIQNDGEEFEDVIRKAVENIEGDCPKYICGDFRTCEKLKMACASLGEPTNLIVWKKPVQQRLHKWEYCHEFIWYFGKNGSGFVDGNVWECKREIAKMHPTIKPVELIQRAILAHEGESVVDLFGGSGSTLIACEKTNRICYMMELDEKYVDVIIARWEDYTGQKAIKIV